jgi:hypothetical protein
MGCIHAVMLFLLVGYSFSLGLISPSEEFISIVPADAHLPSALSSIISALSTLQRKPSCYRSAAASVIEHCKSLPMDIPDPDRIHFAIKLTVCELDLIHQTPAVCQIESQWRSCVHELATNDNWWTSFSGNLREVVSVCWIGRREVEKGYYLTFRNH